jgi:hypothetical protein
VPIAATLLQLSNVMGDGPRQSFRFGGPILQSIHNRTPSMHGTRYFPFELF